MSASCRSWSGSRGSPTRVFQKEGRRSRGRGTSARIAIPSSWPRKWSSCSSPQVMGLGVRMYLPWKRRQGWAAGGRREPPQGQGGRPGGADEGTGAPLPARPTLFLLTAELGHSSRRDSDELCSSLHTCHRKCRKEPPVGHTETDQHGDPSSPPARGPCAHLDLSSFASPRAATVQGREDLSKGG